MATEATMIREVQRLGVALTNYAESMDWSNQAYRIYYHVNSEWGRIHLAVVADEFDGKDNHECYRSVWEYLDRFFSNQPYGRELLDSINLVVRGRRQAESSVFYSIGPEYYEFWADPSRAYAGVLSDLRDGTS